MQTREDYFAYRFELDLFQSRQREMRRHIPEEAYRALYWTDAPPTSSDILHLPSMRHLASAEAIFSAVIRERIIIQNERKTSQPLPHPSRQVIASRNRALAVRALGNPIDGPPDPTIHCTPGNPSRIRADGDNGSVNLPIHWHLSVHRHGIAVCDWPQGTKKTKYGTKPNIQKVLVVRAQKQVSAFLADRGITYFVVEGLQLGKSAKIAHGYAFCAKGCNPHFSPSFRSGVAVMERLLMAKMEKMMGL